MLKYENVDISVSGEKILEGINIIFKKGKLTTVIGPNGCGKTTLVQVLNGSSKVTNGEIFLDEEDYLSIKQKERAKRLSFLPQVRTVIPAIKTSTLVSHGRFPYIGFSRMSTPEDKRVVRESMKKASVDEYADQNVDTLSGGVRQRAFVAMQLAQDCDYVVADEPTTYLDLPGTKKVLDIYSTLRDEGKTVILVLHDIVKALEISDEIIVMNDRKIVYTGTPTNLLDSGIIEDVFDTKIKKLEDEGRTYYVVDNGIKKTSL